MLRFMATPVKDKDLKPGDLFSPKGPEFWDGANEHKCYCGSKHPVAAALFVTLEAEPNSDPTDDVIYLLTPREE